MTYLPRIIDNVIRQRLTYSGAVLVEGPKACGKTDSARQQARSEVRMDTDPFAAQAMAVDPTLLLVGATPRLLDEWQTHPQIWNHVRRAVDDRQTAGQFILTGSANPDQDIARHSGAGRLSRVRMRPMSLWESGHSNGTVSLASLLASDAPSPAYSDNTLPQIIERVTVGGWPGFLNRSVEEASAGVRDYVDLIADVDVGSVGGMRRDPARVRRLMRSLARSTAQETSVSTLAADTAGADAAISRDSVIEYMGALERLMICEDQPAWAPHLRSAAAVRKAPKRHFVDPSIAVAVLRADPAALMNDLNTLGFLFESLVVRDLRIYAQANDASVSHYRDSNGREVDAIVERSDGTWAAFEVKLGPGAIDDGAASLLAFTHDVDTSRTGTPAALTVITGWGLTHRRSDGVNVVPISTLSA